MIAPIAGTIAGPNVLVVNNNVPARNVAELAAMLRAKPGEIPYVSTGVGQSTHLSPVLFLQMLTLAQKLFFFSLLLSGDGCSCLGFFCLSTKGIKFPPWIGGHRGCRCTPGITRNGCGIVDDWY